MIIDLTFTHQRPQAIASFWSLSAVLSNSLLTSSRSVINSLGGWRAFYFCLGPFGLTSVVLAVSFYPETCFKRPAVAFDGHVIEQSATERVRVYEGRDQIV